MLAPGDSVPHFDVTSVDGGRVRYSEIWQRRNLVLIALSEKDARSSAAYVADLFARRAEWETHNAECIVTVDPVADMPAPGAVVADRWGQVAYAAHPVSVVDLPHPDELLNWVEHVQTRCPECEGEAR